MNATAFSVACLLREAEIAKGSTPAFMQHLFHAVNYVLVLAPPLLHVTWLTWFVPFVRGWKDLV